MSDYIKWIKLPIALGVGIACKRYMSYSQVSIVIPSAIIIYETRSVEATKGLAFLYAPYYLFKLGHVISEKIGDSDVDEVSSHNRAHVEAINHVCAGLSLYCIYRSSSIFSNIIPKAEAGFWPWVIRQGFTFLSLTQMSYFLLSLTGFGTVYILTEYAKRRLGISYQTISRYVRDITDAIDMERGNDRPADILSVEDLERIAPLRCRAIRNSEITEEFSIPDNCSICLEHFNVNQLHRMLRCRHSFHTECIDKWLASHRACPICRSSIYGDDDSDN